jgi:hypothetical protein
MKAIKVTSPASKLLRLKSLCNWLVRGPETSPKPITRKARKMGDDLRKLFFVILIQLIEL